MNKWLKRILAAVASVLVLLVVAALVLPFAIDPNRVKGPLQRLARTQDIHLTLAGPINWRFYPRLGLSLQDVIIAPLQQPNEPLARADGATAAVALLPLLSGEILVNELVLDGPAIDLVVDEEGRGNWEVLSRDDDKARAEKRAEDEAAGQGLNLAVERIAINNGTLSYENQRSGQSATLRDLSIQLADVNLENRFFPLTVEAVLATSALPSSLQIEMESQLQTNAAFDRLALADGRLQLDAGNVQLTLTVSGQAALQPEMQYQGRVELEPFNPSAFFTALGQALPTTADPTALSEFGFIANVSGAGNQLIAEQLALTLDQTELTGSLALAMPKAGLPSLEMRFMGDEINVDRYLAPPAEEDPSAAAVAAGPQQPMPLPLDSLRGFNLNLAAEMERITAAEMDVTAVRLALIADNGLWTLKELRGNFYQGTLASEGRVDARLTQGDMASMAFSAQMNELTVHPLLMDLAEFSDLSGVVSGKLQAETQARTLDQLVENLSAAFVFNSPQLTFQGVNAEYFYCQMATQLADGEMPEMKWPARTQITEVKGRLVFDESRLTIASLVAYVENLVLTATGDLDLDAMDYRVRVPMRLAQQQTSAAGCLIESNFLQNREVDVLGCAGSLEQVDFGEQCGLDSGAVAKLAEQALRYNVEKRVTEKKEEIREDLKEKLREKLGDEEADSARNLLRDLLNR